MIHAALNRLLVEGDSVPPDSTSPIYKFKCGHPAPTAGCTLTDHRFPGRMIVVDSCRGYEGKFSVGFTVHGIGNPYSGSCEDAGYYTLAEFVSGRMNTVAYMDATNSPEAIEPEQPICATCRFHVAEDYSCRRYPPQASDWPCVNSDDWCGEHSPRTPAAPPTTERVPLPVMMHEPGKIINGHLIERATNDERERCLRIVREMLECEWRLETETGYAELARRVREESK